MSDFLILIYDREDHACVNTLAAHSPTQCLVTKEPDEVLARIPAASVVCIHATDEARDVKRHKQSVAKAVLAMQKPLVLYSGGGIPQDLATKLKQKDAQHKVLAYRLTEFCGRLETALRASAPAPLIDPDPVSDMLELLITLWCVGLDWENSDVLPQDLKALGDMHTVFADPKEAATQITLATLYGRLSSRQPQNPWLDRKESLAWDQLQKTLREATGPDSCEKTEACLSEPPCRSLLGCQAYITKLARVRDSLLRACL